MWLVQAVAVVAAHGTGDEAKGAMISSQVRFCQSWAWVVSRRMR
jgi:hypothetical protein